MKSVIENHAEDEGAAESMRYAIFVFLVLFFLTDQQLLHAR